MRRLLLMIAPWVVLGCFEAWGQSDDFDKKVIAWDSLEVIYTRTANYKQLAKVKQDKALFLIEDKKFGLNAASLRLLLESAHLYGRSGDSTSYYILKNQLNYYYTLSGKPSLLLLDDLKESISFFEKNRNQIQLIWAHELILSYLVGQRDYQTALTYKIKLHRLAAQLSDSKADRASKAVMASYLATYYLEKFQHQYPDRRLLDSAETHVKQIARYVPFDPKIHWLSGYYEYYLGLIAEFRKNYDQALVHYFRCRANFTDNNSKLQLNLHIEECYHQKGNFKKAHQYAVQNRQLMDTLRKSFYGYLGDYSKTWEVLQNTELENLLIKEQEKTAKAKANQLIQWVVLGGLILMVIVVFIFQWQFSRYQRAAFRLQLQLSQQRRDSADKILAVQEQERQSLARELHDSLGGMLAISKLTAENIQAKWKNPNVGVLVEQLQSTQSELYKIINHFQPSVISLKESLSDWLFQLQRFHPLVAITFNHSGQEHGEPVVHQQLFRIIQELVHNAIKHAQAKHLLVELNYYERSTIILVKDDGVGFDRSKINRGWGLENVQIRLNMLGGGIEYQPGNPSGMEILIHLDRE